MHAAQCHRRGRRPSYPGSMLSLSLRVGTLVAGILPDSVSDVAGGIIDQVRGNPALMRALIGIGVVTAGIFVFGIVKHAFKSALIGGLLSAAAWWWFVTIR
jgi:hypothetical protein